MLKLNGLKVLTAIFFFILLFGSGSIKAQNSLKGYVSDGLASIPYARVYLTDLAMAAETNAEGFFIFNSLPDTILRLRVTSMGYQNFDTSINVSANLPVLKINLTKNTKHLRELVVTGTMREVSKDQSPVSIDIISAKIFQKTSTPNLFEATALVNGVKPQNSCNVCNTGEIRINGLSGPYTLVLIDGMPIVSGLSSVYGLMGIPAGILKRMEVVKGPAAALYGSEAMGGVINVITKDACHAENKIFADYYLSSWKENNLDFSIKTKLDSNKSMLTGINAFWYNQKIDHNADGFTDLAIQKRFSVFNKIDFERDADLLSTIAIRAIAEDRWGGEPAYTSYDRGTDRYYAESIQTKRVELISKHQWKSFKDFYSQFSYNFHDQNSYYGLNPFFAKQSTGFLQSYWQKNDEKNAWLIGLSYKNLWFDDNTPATAQDNGLINKPELMHTTGLFIQNEITADSLKKNVLLLGARLDYNNVYKFIPSPRLAYKYSPNERHIFRLNAGTGFRIVNVFTEDHMALSGARKVVFTEKINPEKSYNASITYQYKMPFLKHSIIEWDLAFFYYHFTNKIIANYDINPQLIVYSNVNEFAFCRGFSASAQYQPLSRSRVSFGFTFNDVKNSQLVNETNLFVQQLFSPKWTGNYQFSHAFGNKENLKLDVIGNFTGSMRLPVFPNDYRPEFSPAFNLINIQLTHVWRDKVEVYAGSKNVLNFVPKNPLMRPFDPFNKNADDKINNPYGFTFDPSYAYASMQGRRYYVGVRLNF